MEKRIRFTIILVLILIVVIAFSFQSKEKKEYLVYNEALDKTAVTVDDVSLTLKDIAFYVAYEEKTVQEQAILYNPDNPRQYWNVYTDGQFVKLTAKQAALDMAVHDEIFYQMAVAEGVKLDVTEQEYLENDESDFWSDLEDWQREQLGISEEELDSEMEKIALAESMDGCAKAIVAKAKEAGVVMTGAGATYPYGKDPKDSNIRIAPSFPPIDELAKAAEVFVVCVKLASVEKLLAE